jgi:hypothetical protein
MQSTAWRVVGVALSATVAGLLVPLAACKSRPEPTTLQADGHATTVWRDFTSYREDLGVHPDCSEKPMSYQDFKQLALTANDPLDFLKKLERSGAMQTFTLLQKSESTQMTAISPATPGVIRMTEDGKISLRYVCDRTKDTLFSHMEVIRFDDDTQRFQFIDFDFSQGTRGDEHRRIHDNPKVCFACHNQSQFVDDPRPNWSMYPDWPVAFASHDDFFPTGTKKDVDPRMVNVNGDWQPASRQDERQAFQRFLQAKVKGPDADPCYTTLPWPKQYRTGQPLPKPELYAEYPYGTYNANASKRMYALRPNLKLTETFSKLLGRRNFRRIKSTPGYEQLSRLLAYEAARCFLYEDAPGALGYEALKAKAREVLPSFETPDEAAARSVPLRGFVKHHHDPRHPSSMAQVLYGVSRAFKMMPGDWTLTFGYPMRPEFETGAGPGKSPDFYEAGGDLPLTAYVQHEILTDVVRTTGLKTRDGKDALRLIGRATGESDDFGSHFACIDNVAGPTLFHSEQDPREFDEDARMEVCGALTQEISRFYGGLTLTDTVVEPLKDGPALFDEPFNKETEPLQVFLQELQEKYPGAFED